MAVDKNGWITIALRDSTLGLVTIRAAGRTIRLFLNKGDKLNIEVDTAASLPIHISGPNAAGQELLSQNILATHYYYLIDEFRNDSTWESFSNHVSRNKSKQQQLFQQLYESKKINRSFQHFSLRWIDYLYASLTADHIAGKFYGSVFPKDNPSKRFAQFKESYGAHWTGLFSQLPPNDPRGLDVPVFSQYVQSYVTSYEDFTRWASGDSSVIDQQTRLRNIQTVIGQRLLGKVAEYTSAEELYFASIQEQFESVLPELFNEFVRKYPTSGFTRFLAPYNQKVVDFYRIASRSFRDDQQFITLDSSASSLNDLTRQLTGRPVYMDIWATWCGPCKEEFKFKDSLASFLKQHDIRLVYLSFDDDRFDEQWKNMIKYYGLTGYHIRATENLQKELITLLTGRYGPFSIPRYVLFNASGKMIEADALHPSDGVNLYKQIEMDLNAK